jgi:hypothetical protein
MPCLEVITWLFVKLRASQISIVRGWHNATNDVTTRVSFQQNVVTLRAVQARPRNLTLCIPSGTISAKTHKARAWKLAMKNTLLDCLVSAIWIR